MLKFMVSTVVGGCLLLTVYCFIWTGFIGGDQGTYGVRVSQLQYLRSTHTTDPPPSQWRSSPGGSSSMNTSTSSSLLGDTVLQLCPVIPPNLQGSITAQMEVFTFEELVKRHTQLSLGGRFKPFGCIARHRVAIIVPYRDRESHLKIFLNNIHPMLQRQQLDYGIFVVEQAMPGTFNKAMMMNIGYTEALKEFDFQCVIFHDVDLLPENDKNLYTCPKIPRHMAVALDKHKYKLYYSTAFGGVLALTKEHMKTVNGFSNRYFGWGMEDDDMYRRVQLSRLSFSRPSADVARYKNILHQRDETNPENMHRGKIYRQVDQVMKTDGLNSLSYNVLKKEQRKLYTWFLVKIESKM